MDMPTYKTRHSSLWRATLQGGFVPLTSRISLAAGNCLADGASRWGFSVLHNDSDAIFGNILMLLRETIALETFRKLPLAPFVAGSLGENGVPTIHSASRVLWQRRALDRSTLFYLPEGNKVKTLSLLIDRATSIQVFGKGFAPDNALTYHGTARISLFSPQSDPS